MDAMKEALKRKMEKMKGQGLEIEINLGHDDEENEDKDDSKDMAPDLAGHEDGLMSQDSKNVVDPSKGHLFPEGSPDHLDIVKSFADSSNPGRGPMGLHERAAALAKEKLLALKGKMKG